MRIALSFVIAFTIMVSIGLYGATNSFGKMIHSGQWSPGPVKTYQNPLSQSNNRFWPPDPCFQGACASGTSGLAGPGSGSSYGKYFPPNPIKKIQ